MTKLF